MEISAICAAAAVRPQAKSSKKNGFAALHSLMRKTQSAWDAVPEGDYTRELESEFVAVDLANHRLLGRAPVTTRQDAIAALAYVAERPGLNAAPAIVRRARKFLLSAVAL